LSVGMCPKMRPVGVTKKRKKGQKLSCVKLAICPDHPRRHRPLKFCVRGRVLEVVIYFKYHENRSRGLGVVGGGSKIALSHWQGPSLPYTPWCLETCQQSKISGKIRMSKKHQNIIFMY